VLKYSNHGDIGKSDLNVLLALLLGIQHSLLGIQHKRYNNITGLYRSNQQIKSSSQLTHVIHTILSHVNARQRRRSLAAFI